MLQKKYTNDSRRKQYITFDILMVKQKKLKQIDGYLKEELARIAVFHFVLPFP